MKIKIYHFAVLFLLVLVGNVNAQTTFQKTYGSGFLGGTNAPNIATVGKAFDGGYFFAGTTNANAGDFYLMKLNFQGDTLWTKTYGGNFDDVVYSALQTPDSGYLLAGSTRSFSMGGWDAYLIKTDVNGNIIWSKNYGGFDDDWFSSIQLTNDGGFIACGTTFTFGSGIEDVYLLKLDPSGSIQWTKTFGGSGWERGTFVQQTFDNGFIITGYTTSFTAASGRVYLLKTDSLGNVGWSKIFGGVMGEEGFCVKQCSDSGYIVTGYTNSFGTGSQDVFLLKTNESGNLSWMKTYGNISMDLGYYVSQTTDNGFILAARTYSFGQADYLIKTDAYGDTLWSKAYPGQAGLGHFVVPTNDGGYILASSSNFLKLIKTDSMGNTGCNELIPNTIVTIASPVILSGALTNSGGSVTNSATITRYTSITIDTLCLTTGINNVMDNKEMKIYPNPATDQLHLTLTKPSPSNTTITVMDMQGRVVKEIPVIIHGSDAIDVSTLFQGVYLLKVNGQVQRFVKM